LRNCKRVSREGSVRSECIPGAFIVDSVAALQGTSKHSGETAGTLISDALRAFTRTGNLPPLRADFGSFDSGRTDTSALQEGTALESGGFWGESKATFPLAFGRLH